MSRSASTGAFYRIAVAGRVVLAVLGGYAVAALSTVLLSVGLPLARSEAVATGTLSSFAVMAAAVIWVFAAPSLARAALGLGLAAACLAILSWLAGGFAFVGAA